jgi:hypothetical protein
LRLPTSAPESSSVAPAIDTTDLGAAASVVAERIYANPAFYMAVVHTENSKECVERPIEDASPKSPFRVFLLRPFTGAFASGVAFVALQTAVQGFTPFPPAPKSRKPANGGLLLGDEKQMSYGLSPHRQIRLGLV